MSEEKAKKNRGGRYPAEARERAVRIDPQTGRLCSCRR